MTRAAGADGPSELLSRVLKDFTSRNHVHNCDRDIAANGGENVPPI